MFYKDQLKNVPGDNGHKSLIHLDGLSKSYYSEGG